MTGGRCTFTLAPAAWTDRTGIPCEVDESLLEDGVWRCPRARRGEDYCVFHQPPEATDERLLGRRLRNAAAGTPEREAIAEGVLSDAPTDRELARVATRLLGVRADRLALESDRLDAGDTRPLDLRYGTVDTVAFEDLALSRPLDLRGVRATTVVLTGAMVGGDVRLGGARVEDAVEAAEATVEGSLAARDATVGRVVAASIRVSRDLDWRRLTVRGGVDVRGARVDSRLRCRFAAVEGGDFDASRIRLTGETPYQQIHQLSCKGLTVTGSIVFDGAVVDGAVRLNDATAGGDLTITDATLRSHVWLGAVDSEHGRSGSATATGSIKLTGTEIGGELDLAGAESDGGYLSPPTAGSTVDLAGVVVDGPALLEPDLSDSPIDVVDVSGAVLSSGTVAQAAPSTPVVYDLQGATVGDLRFEGDDDTTPLRYARLLETEFDGFDFTWHREQIEAQSWEIYRTRGASPAAVALSRQYDSAVRYARDAVALFESFPDARSFVVDADTDALTATAVATRAFGPPDEAPDLDTETHHEVLPPAVTARENSRMGLVMRVLRHHTDGVGHPLVEAFERPATARALTALAAAVADADGAVDAATVDTEVAALSTALADHLADPAAHDPTPAQLESTYLRARNGADRVGDTTAAGEFYIRELLQRRAQHRRRIGADGIVWPTVDYVSNRLLGATAGFGERPRNTFLISVGLVAVFAGVFSVVTDEEPYGTAWGYLILSLESFVTLVLGGADAVSSTVRLIAQIEGFLGAFLIALFVFTLTRSLDR